MIVFKYGGHAISEKEQRDPILGLLAKAIASGERIVLVHGGGPQINRELEIHGIKSEMLSGLRRTTPEVFAVVQRTLSGEVLRNLVNQLVGFGVNAIGISAGDGNLIRAEITNPELGLVGEVSDIDISLLLTLLNEGLTPVISPVGVTREGIGVNMNADLVAGAIGGAMAADSVLFSTDVAGIYRNWPDVDSVIDVIEVDELIKIARGFEGGIIPKAQSAIRAIKAGAKSVRVFDGRSVAGVQGALANTGGTLVVA